MAHFSSDVRFAVRGLRKRPAQSLLIVVTLAVGLASNATIFSALDALLLRPLPFPNLPRLVRLWETSPGSDPYWRSNIAPANLQDWQASGLFEALVAFEWWDANLRGHEALERVSGIRVSPGFFTSLGVRPRAGRDFLAEEGTPGLEHRAVVGYELWRRGFGAQPDLVGQTITLDADAYTVVGIAPEGFQFPEGAELWAPLVLPPAGAAPRDKHHLGAIGLLAKDRRLEEARAALAVVAGRLQKEHPETNTARGAQLEALQRGFEDIGLRPVMALWQLAAGLVLLLACVNVANLTLARGAERQRELAVRLALGADRRRVVQLLLTEGAVVAVLGIGLALPLAALASAELRRHMPAEIVRFIHGWSEIGLDARVAAFLALLGIAATLLFAAVPALRSSRPALTEALKEGGRSATVGAGRQRGRNLLVVTQVAGALSLLVVAGLALKSVHAMLAGPQGYDPDQLLTLEVSLPDNRYQSPAARRAFVRDAQGRLAALAGVAEIAYANVLPGRGNNWTRAIELEGEPPYDKSNPPTVNYRAVSPSYFTTLRQPVLAGRGFSASDDESALPVAVVSRALAEKYWPGRDPLGLRLKVDGDEAPLVTVVGVCGDVIHHWFASRNQPTVYRPYAQVPSGDLGYALRTTGDPEALGSSARGAISAVDPLQPASAVRSMRRSIRISTIGIQYVGAIMAIFGSLAVVLAVSGIYGVMSYRISLRTLEIGVRVALGASSSDVLKLTMGQALQLTALGLLLGAGMGWAGARGLSGALAGAVPFDAAIFAGWIAAVAAAALLSAYLPARRALSLDPATALRAE